MKSLRVAVGAAALALVALPGTGWAQTVFSEDFSGAVPGGSYSGAIGGTQFTSSGPNVDIVGELNGGFFQCVGNLHGNCIDTVGNQGAGGVITSTPFALVAGTAYTLAFTDILQGFGPTDLATANYSVTVGGFTALFTATPTVVDRTFSFTPLVSSAAATLAFTVLTAPDAVHGPVLSNISITGVAPPASGVPEPATWAMMILGFGAVGAAARRRHRIGLA